MDNPNRWNITNSAQNIVSALVDPSKQFDSVFRREWANAFAGFSKHPRKLSTSTHNVVQKDNYGKDNDGKTKKKYTFTRSSNDKTTVPIDDNESAVNNVSLPIQIPAEVPQVFLDKDFNLSNIKIFNEIVSSTSINLPEASQSSGLSTSNNYSHQTVKWRHDEGRHQALTKKQLRELQQIYTDHLDLIEEMLASRISNRSGDFFRVMSSVDSVMDELSLAIKCVSNLRRKCARLSETSILPNMRSINLSKARNNAQNLLEKLSEIAYLARVQPMIQLLLSASDFVGALDLIAKSRAMLHKDLERIVCLRHLESELVEIERMIATMMQQEFLTLISSEWSGPISGQQASAAMRLSKLFEYFANEFSNLPKQGNNSTLLSLLHIQADKFVNQFHEERKKRIEATLDVEQWKVFDSVPEDFQRLITMLVDEDCTISETFASDIDHQQTATENESSGENVCQTSVSINSQMFYLGHSRAASDTIIAPMSNNRPDDSPASVRSQKLHQQHLRDYIQTDGMNSLDLLGCKTDNDKNHNESNFATSRHPISASCVHANGSTFVIVTSVINLMRTIMDYCKCAQDIRSLSAELLERLFKILSLYNSKTYHLVYSAGAIQIAGLKTITTRSLVVSQRSLKLIILVIPAIHKHFAHLLPNDKRLRRFNEIKTSYEEHATKIPERVNSIVKDVFNLQLQEWEARPPVPSAQFSAVTQHLMRLHENINDVLPIDELRALFKKISETFKSVLVTHLHRLNIHNDVGPQQWHVTQELTFYKLSLAKLDGFSGWDLTFDDLWAQLDSYSSSLRVQEAESNIQPASSSSTPLNLTATTTNTKSNVLGEKRSQKAS